MRDVFKLVFYEKASGGCPVAEFLASLNKEMRFKMMQKLDYLELYGNMPKGDFTKPVGDGIFEVRAQNKTDITRILFFFDKNREVVLTNGFVKKSQRMPMSELETAKRYRADYLERQNEKNKMPDREPGRKAGGTAGPQWRPRLDDILSDANGRSAERAAGSKNAGEKMKPRKDFLGASGR